VCALKKKKEKKKCYGNKLFKSKKRIVNNHQSSPPQPHHHEVALCYGEALLSVALSCSLKQLQYSYHFNKIACC